MFTVQYKINVAGKALEIEHGLIDLNIHVALAIPSHYCRLQVMQQALPAIKLGDTLTVHLGYEESLHLVFSGLVTTVNHSMQVICIEAMSAFYRLTSLHLNLHYEKRSAGDMLKDVVSLTQLTADTIETGLKFPYYLFDDSRHLWQQLYELAHYCGFDFYANQEDKVVLQKYSAKTTHSVTYGENIIDCQSSLLAATVEGINTFGESPVGQGQSEEATTWFTKKLVAGKAGKNNLYTQQMINPFLRNKDLATNVAKNVLARYQVKQRGHIKLLGNPLIYLGDAIKPTKLPIPHQNGTFKVTSIQHQLNKKRGFISTIEWDELP